MANQHPPHPRFLDVDWPQNHEAAPTAQPLQLENEYDIDPSRYAILQSDFQLQPQMDRHRPQQDSGFPVDFTRPFGGQNDYAFTFPNPQQQHQQQAPQQQQQPYDEQQMYGAGPYFPEHQGSVYPQGGQGQAFHSSGMSYGDGGNQPTPSSPSYYTGDSSPFTFTHQSLPSQAQVQGIPVGQHSRAGSASGLTPTFRTFQQGDASQIARPRPVFSNAGTPVTPSFAQHPNLGTGYGMPLQPGAPYREQAHMQLGDASAALHAAKRQRALDEAEGEGSSVDGDDRSESGTHVKEEAKPAKPPGACARCKSLKVKCEFKTNPDICKRCLNGNHECIIPGRKKRRAPPRRDLLLGQIREQAAKIEELMKQLEEANKRAGQKPQSGASGEQASSPAHSADHRSTMSATTSELTTSDIGTPEPAPDHITKPDVLDWIAKARESIEAFGGYINMGGPSVTKDMLGEDVLGWKDSSSSDEAEEEEGAGAGGEQQDDGEVHVEVEYVDDTKPADGERPVSRGRAQPGGQSRGGSSARSKDQTSQGSRRKKSRGRDKLAILPNEAAPIGMLANLSLRASRSRRSSRSRSVSTADDNDFGVANDDYFRASSPGPDRPIMYAQHQTPYILRSGLVSPTEVEKLFKIYFDYINPSVSLLDPVLYTAQRTYWRSPFLFTVVCGIASRFYSERPDLYQQAMNCARLAAGSTLIGGQKSVETVQAYILLSLYPVPARKWEEDRCWVYLGLAIRIATDLNLHHPNTVEPKNEQHAREMLNRTRTWLNCFNLDRSISSQYGKAPIISNTDYVASHSEFWWKSSPYNIPGFDIHLCAYNAELKVLADYRYTIFSDPEHPVGLNKTLDITEVASTFDDKLARLGETWLARIQEANFEGVQCEFRTSLLKLAYSYARMTVLSFAFQHTFGRETSQGFSDAFFWRCFRASKGLIRTLLDELGTPRLRVYLRHGPDAESVFVTFTCAFLIKSMHPRYAQYISRDTRVEIRHLVEEVADFLGSPDVAVDDRHGPKLYSRFLKGLLETPLASIDHPPSASKRSAKPPAPSPPTPDSRPGSSSPMPPTPVSVSQPPHPEQGNTKEQQQHFGQVSSGDTQMFDGLELGYLNQEGQTINASELYSPPLPFDHELLQSMQSLTDPNWSNMVLPGFNWMDAIQDQDIQMRYNSDLDAPPQQ